jgi:predicted transcriptional regulator
MTGNMFNFTKEMGEILVAFRKKARLSQSEVAERMGLSATSGDSYQGSVIKQQMNTDKH